jgi:hypothetical protein
MIFTYIFYFAIILLLIWFLFWTDIILYWSDPLNIPKSFFTKTNNKTKKNDEYKDEEKFCVVGCGFCGLV